MQYDDTIDESRQYLRIALELLGKYELTTDPVNYCVWYEYASGKNKELNTVIEKHLENGGSFSQSFCQALYNQHITGRRDKVTSLVREALKKIFSEIAGTIQKTRQDFSQSESNLETINDSIAPNISEANVEKIVQQIKAEIQTLESSSLSFREQLRQATREIDQLKSKMLKYRNEAMMDSLTRIANRRGFEKSLDQSIQNANQTATQLCLIMADIDHFKKINDTHGHLVGDNVLRMIASTIKSSIKGKDHAARIGGEEFAIILPETPFDGAMKLADNMRLAFDRLDLKKKNTGESLGRITLSFGVATYQPNEPTDDFVQRADEALYQSKKTGRNKVTGGKGPGKKENSFYAHETACSPGR
jgi:diguanylate cyclase